MNYDITTKTVSVTETLETIELTKGIFICKLTVQTIGVDGNTSTEISTYYEGNKFDDCVFYLAHKNIRDLHRHYDIFSSAADAFKDHIYMYAEYVPFDEILSLGDAWIEHFDLLDYHFYDHSLRTLEGIPLPKRMFFDYILGIDNSRFDLTGLYNYLETLESVELLSGISAIPSYNRSSSRTHQIEFTIRPTDEEWKGFLAGYTDKYYSSAYISERIFEYYGITNFSK